MSMFDSMALAFHTKLDSYGREPRVIIVTSVNPKIVGGMSFFCYMLLVASNCLFVFDLSLII